MHEKMSTLSPTSSIGETCVRACRITVSYVKIYLKIDRAYQLPKCQHISDSMSIWIWINFKVRWLFWVNANSIMIMVWNLHLVKSMNVISVHGRVGLKRTIDRIKCSNTLIWINETRSRFLLWMVEWNDLTTQNTIHILLTAYHIKGVALSKGKKNRNNSDFIFRISTTHS